MAARQRARPRTVHPELQRRAVAIHPFQPCQGAPGRRRATGRREPEADCRRSPGRPAPDPQRRAGAGPRAPAPGTGRAAPDPAADPCRPVPVAQRQCLAQPSGTGRPAAGYRTGARADRTRRRRAGPGGHLCRRADQSRLCQFVRRLWLASGQQLQFRLQPVPRQRPGGEGQLRRAGVGQRRVRPAPGTGPRAAGVPGSPTQDPRPRPVPRLPGTGSDGRDHGHAVLGRFFGAGHRQQEQPAATPVCRRCAH
jgi:hypothetical protein